jgi:hypothetical protein
MLGEGGVHFFEVRIDWNSGAYYSGQSVGVGMGGIRFAHSNTDGWGGSYNGIGWYSNGNVYSSGRAHTAIGTWKTGDHLGILLNLEGEEPVVSFYSNRVRVSPSVIRFIKKDAHENLIDDKETNSGPKEKKSQNDAFYLHAFMGSQEKVTLLYCGPKPNDLKELPDKV